MSETTPTETPETPVEPTTRTCTLGFEDCAACRAFPVVLKAEEWGLQKSLWIDPNADYTGHQVHKLSDIRKSDEW
jgi:hypothetical protein